MKRLSICLLLAIICFAANAQYALNSFLRQNQDAIRVSDRIEDLSTMVNGNCIYNVKNLSASTRGRTQLSSGTSTSATASLPNKYNATRYSISYPSGWSYLENVQSADVYIGANDGSIAFTILSFSTPYSLDEVMEEANSKAARAGWKKINTSTTLCGVKCYKSTVTYTFNGMAVKQIQYTLKKNGYVYNLNFGIDAAKVNANSSLISTIANSFIIK